MTNELFLIDTSVWLFSLRKNYIPEIKERVSHLLREERVVTTPVIKLELLGGTTKENEFQRLKDRLDAIQCVEMDTSVWERAYGLAFKTRRSGITIPYIDVLIAACSLASHATLVHADTHFDLLSEPFGLKTESLVQTVRDAAQ
ncbi:MAG: PIN domain nuclease [bacterium]